MIYISLTTVPLRLKYWDGCKLNLESLLSQKTNKEYRVVLSIPFFYVMNNNEEYVVPDELWKFAENNPRLIINRDTYDYGPIVKILGGLKYATNPDDIIIALDDCFVYHEDMLETHLQKLDEHPNCAICFNGDSGIDKRSWIDENGIKKYMLIGTHFYIPPLYDHYLQIPGHWHSVSYRRSFFKEDFNEDVWTLSDGDDLIMGYYLKKHELSFMCCERDNETDFRPTNMLGRSNVCFPIVKSLEYPLSPITAGNLIRTKYPGTNHGRVKQELFNLLHDLSQIYVEK